jgi:hypothetical protein
MKSFFNYSFIIILFCSIEIFSLPRFALRQGGTCIDCHVNPTGGNLRNDGGWSYGKNALPMKSTPADFIMSNRLANNIQFGLDYRTQFLTKEDSISRKGDFQKMAASIYANVELSDEIDVTTRYDFIWGITEAYVTARVLPNNSYIKAGSFQPNFGIRLDDHTAYTRGGDMNLLFDGSRGLIYRPAYTETGIEAGAFINDFALITASAGSPHGRPFQTDPSYTGSVQIYPPFSDEFSFLFGGSYSNFKRQNFMTGGMENITMYGGFAGFGIGNFTLLAEYDIAKDYLTADVTSNAVMVEASYRLMKGLEAVVRYDRFDPDKDVEDNELSRVVLGLEVFPFSFIEIRPQYRIQMEVPSVKNNSIVVQMHLYY